MTLQQIPMNHEHLTLWLEGEKGMLFHAGEKSLFMLEPLSLALLFAMDEGANIDRAIAQIQAHNYLPDEQLRPFAEQVKTLLRYSENQHKYSDGLYPELANILPLCVEETNMMVKIGGTKFAISSEDDALIAQIEKVLKPIIINDQNNPNPAANTPDFHLELIKEGHYYALYSNSIEIVNQLTMAQVMPELIDRLQILSYQNKDYLFGFHGGALTLTPPNASPLCILLPGISGAGKSTLTAELAKQGFKVHSDEVISIDKANGLHTIDLPMAIKSGSWPHISTIYPELSQADEFQRLDGRILKYIWPMHKQQANGESLTTISADNTQIICPVFSKEGTNQKTALSIIDTITMITKGGYQVGLELNMATVQQLIDFCASAKRYKIEYSSSEQAFKYIQSIAGQGAMNEH